jgi:PAS domain S-box-containing protein
MPRSNQAQVHEVETKSVDVPGTQLGASRAALGTWATERRTTIGFIAVALALIILLSGIYLSLTTQMRSTPWVYALIGVTAVFLALLASLLLTLLAELKEHRDVAALLLESIPTMVFAKDATDLRFVRFNRAGERLLGYSRETLLGRSDHDFFPPDQAEFFVNKDREALGQTDAIDIPAEEIDTRELGRRVLHTRKVPVRDKNGKATLLLGVSMDITEQKAAELRIRTLNGELSQRSQLLESSNRELEHFSYSVAHDLRAPLRAIDRFAGLLEEQFADRLDQKGLRYLNLIHAASVRMGRLIGDLLEFARLGRQVLERAQVDMTALVKRAVAEAIAARDQSAPRVIVEDLPAVRGDRQQLLLVWINLLDNAVKYTSRVGAPQIAIWAERNAAEIIYHVRDNGIGFDMQYYDKLFAVFQRLHSNPDYPGTGVGLAIAQRIIARHGGRLWAQSEPGKGATFSFALPADA